MWTCIAAAEGVTGSGGRCGTLDDPPSTRDRMRGDDFALLHPSIGARRK